MTAGPRTAPIAGSLADEFLGRLQHSDVERIAAILQVNTSSGNSSLLTGYSARS